ncbi:methyl-accepting chemotaxis protein [Aestuariispira insulae]|uniref:Methyl-accepting chemotaxis protein n=1 Tax=Aestuariispira insulae TaxID=1461337 RepID=A0A3D9H9D5_9PROT|nr:methyl-accepting chemotaxis protein [Aestuariispira insulae]RED46095.1 methyl-accepting chemotaxis protein [Aestuariispira insulae]
MMLRALRKKIDVKFVLILALVLTVVMAGQIGGYIVLLNQVLDEENARNQMLAETNHDLREQVFALQEQYLAIPNQLEVNPVAALGSWAAEKGAKPVQHEGRDAIVARYKKRKVRRDVGKPGRFVVDEYDGSGAVSFGLFENGEPKNVVLEYRFKGVPQDQLQADVDKIVADNAGADAIVRKIGALKSSLADAALAAENSRVEILFQFDQIKQKDAAVDDFVERVKTLVAGSGLLAILVAISAAYMVGRMLITRSLVRLKQALKDIAAEKEVSLREVERKDEIGALAIGLHQIQDAQKEANRLRASRDAEREKTKRRVEERLTAVADSLERGMRTSMKDLTNRAHDMTDKAAGLTRLAHDNQAQADQASQLAGANAETAAKILQLSENLVSNGDQMSRAVDQQRHLTGLASRDVAASQKTVEELQRAADQVEEIVQIIQDIAGQTNLLALNATIEATRAGSAGSGFAVVAQEVKKLSAETARSTQEISNRIQAIRSVSGSAAKAIATIDDRIADVNGAMGELTRSCESQIKASRSIAGHVKSSAENAEKVAGSNQSIQRSAETSGEAAGQLSGAMGGIVQALNGMREELFGILHAASRTEGAAPEGARPKVGMESGGAANNEADNVVYMPAAAE